MKNAKLVSGNNSYADFVKDDKENQVTLNYTSVTKKDKLKNLFENIFIDARNFGDFKTQYLNHYSVSPVRKGKLDIVFIHIGLNDVNSKKLRILTLTNPQKKL